MTTEERVLRLENAFATLVEMVRHHDEEIDEMKDSQRHADERIAALADAQIQTERALTRLSETVERFINESRNGKP